MTDQASSFVTGNRTYDRNAARRALNVLETALIRLGIAPRHRYLLTIPGRKSGRPHTTPVALVENADGRWLVAPYGEVAWVRNARAAARVTLSRGRHREECAVAVDRSAAAAAVLKTYVDLEPITRPFFEAGSEAPIAAFAAELDAHPVFRLAPIDQSAHVSMPTPSAAARPRRSLSAPRLAVAAAALAALVIAGAGWSAWSYFDSINRLSRGTAPASVEFATSPGRVVVYYEGHAHPSLSDLEIAVAGPDGASVRVDPFGYDLRYDVGKHGGRAVAVFDAPSAGTYVVTSRIQEAGGRLAVGADLGRVTVAMVVAMIAALFTLGLSVIGTVLFALLSADNRRRAAPSASWLRTPPRDGAE